jgi:hypothetical protein
MSSVNRYLVLVANVKGFPKFQVFKSLIDDTDPVDLVNPVDTTVWQNTEVFGNPLVYSGTEPNSTTGFTLAVSEP